MTFASRTIRFLIYSLAVGLVNLPALRALLDLSMRDSSASHLVVIPFVSLALVYRDRTSIFSAVRSDWRAGLGVMALGMVVLVAAAPSGASLSAKVAAVVILWIGGFVAFYGWQTFRAALFPVLFLGFMIPLPDAVLNGVVEFLKRGSTEAVAVMFKLTGTPFHREGFVFTLPNFVIEVADECSGIRSSIALLLTGLLAGHLYLRGAWKKVVIALAILPITIIKNGIRIVTLSLLAMHVNPSFLTGQLHHEGGIVFFVLALLILAPLFALLRNFGRKPRPEVATV